MKQINKKSLYVVYDKDTHYDIHTACKTSKEAKALFIKKHGKGMTWDELLESGFKCGKIEIILNPN